MRVKHWNKYTMCPSVACVCVGGERVCVSMKVEILPTACLQHHLPWPPPTPYVPHWWNRQPLACHRTIPSFLLLQPPPHLAGCYSHRTIPSLQALLTPSHSDLPLLSREQHSSVVHTSYSVPPTFYSS